MDYVTRYVKKTIKKYKTNDPFEIAKEKGIVINEKPLQETYGIYMKCRRIQFITLNCDLSYQDKRFTCAHELGHAILYPNSNTSFLRKETLLSIDRMEMNVNKFGTHLLIDGECEEWMTKEYLLKICGIPLEMSRFL